MRLARLIVIGLTLIWLEQFLFAAYTVAVQLH